MKKLVEGPFGVMMPGTTAQALESLLKTLPKECRNLRRKATGDSPELVTGEKADISLVSCESIDREGEVVIAKGIDLTQFQANPIVTFCHKYDQLPVGRAQWIKKVPGGVKAKTIYSDATDLARSCWQMTREGILKGKSIGFIPTKLRPPTKDEAQWKNASAVCESCILLEYAVAVLPMNPDALVEAVAKGIADEATLQRLGLALPKQEKVIVKKISETALLLKALEMVKLDADAIAAKVIQRIKERGKV